MKDHELEEAVVIEDEVVGAVVEGPEDAEAPGAEEAPEVGAEEGPGTEACLQLPSSVCSLRLVLMAPVVDPVYCTSSQCRSIILLQTQGEVYFKSVYVITSLIILFAVKVKGSFRGTKP
jgi:hypothetical protein